MYDGIEPIDPDTIFPQLAELPQAPQSLSIRGTLRNISGKKIIAFVGSRTCSDYGKTACRALIEGLKGYPIIIVSGLAIGIDAIAHDAAMHAGLTTFGFPGSGLDWQVLYPKQNHELARNILRSGGILISEYQPNQRATPWTFPKRNRLMAGIADMTIVVEAKEKSGSLITARLGTEYNRIVGSVPGPIDSPTSRGANWLLKLGAVPITESADILRELGIPEKTIVQKILLNSDEERLVALLNEPKSRESLSGELSLPLSEISLLVSTLEIKGVIQERLGVIERLD